jgi:hypothetical protein
MITVKMAIAIAKAKINQSGVPCSFIHARELCSVLQWRRWKNLHPQIWFRPPDAISIKGWPIIPVPKMPKNFVNTP